MVHEVLLEGAVKGYFFLVEYHAALEAKLGYVGHSGAVPSHFRSLLP